MSLRTRLLAAFAYVLILVIVALKIPLILNVSRRVDAEVKAEAAAGAQLVAASAAGELEDGDNRVLTRIAEQAAEESGGRVLVVDRQGRVVADSAGQTGNYGDRQEIRAALEGGVSQGRRFSETLGESLLFTAVPVVVEGDVGGAVRVTQSVDAIDRRVRRDVLGLIGIGLIALVLGLAFAWFLAGTLARPLQRLAATARRVEAGDLGARAEPEGSRENQEVAHAFNDMTERLEHVLVAQREFVANASHQLRTPLTGLRLRLEAASLKAGPDLVGELDAAEREVERLARLLTALLTLAREGDRPPAREVISAVGGAGAGARALGRACGPRGARARAGLPRPRACGGLGRGPGDRPGQSGRERARLLAGRRDGHAGMRPRGARGRRLSRGRRPRVETRRGGAGVRPVCARQQRPGRAWHGAGSRDRRDPGPAVGRQRADLQPGFGRRAGRGPLPCGSGLFANSEQELGRGFTRSRLAWLP